MSDYLLPTNMKLTIEEKRRLFGIRNKMFDIPSNIPNSKCEQKCDCCEISDMEHIYYCETEVKLPYEKIYNRNMKFWKTI